MFAINKILEAFLDGASGSFGGSLGGFGDVVRNAFDVILVLVDHIFIGFELLANKFGFELWVKHHSERKDEARNDENKHDDEKDDKTYWHFCSLLL